VGRTGITKEIVFAAADALIARGEEPTLEAVRTETGTGSNGTIAPIMRAWREDRAKTRQVQAAPIPEEVAQQLALFGGRVWGVATAVAEANLAPQREALAREKAEAQRSVDELQTALDEQEIVAEGLEEARKTADVARGAAEKARDAAVELSLSYERKIGGLEVEVRHAREAAQEAENKIKGMQQIINNFDAERTKLNARIKELEEEVSVGRTK
jgi:hypothetical protein